MTKKNDKWEEVLGTGMAADCAQEAFDAAPVDIAPGASAFADEPVSDAPLRGSIYKLRLHYIYTSQDDIYMYS